MKFDLITDNEILKNYCNDCDPDGTVPRPGGPCDPCHPCKF